MRLKKWLLVDWIPAFAGITILFAFLFAPLTWADTISYTGRLMPAHQTILYSPVKARVVALSVPYGATVQKGDVLWKLQSDDLDNRYRAAKAARLEAEQRLYNTKQLQLPLITLQNQLKRAQLSENRARHRAQHTEKLFQAGIVSEEEKTFDKQALEDAEQTIQETHIALQEVAQQHDGKAQAIAQLQYDNALEEEKRLQKQKLHLVVKAPSAGVLLPPPKTQNTMAALTLGAFVQEEQPLGIVAEIGGYHVEIRVDELEVVQLQEGQPVTAALVAFPDIPLKGVVHQVGRHPLEEGSQALWAQYEVVVALEAPQSTVPLQYGMQVTTDIETDGKTHGSD
jgi:HlyD family secretion protein